MGVGTEMILPYPTSNWPVVIPNYFGISEMVNAFIHVHLDHSQSDWFGYVDGSKSLI